MIQPSQPDRPLAAWSSKTGHDRGVHFQPHDRAAWDVPPVGRIPTRR
jgi:hypothetical protein